MSSTVANPFVVGGAISDPGGKGFYGRDDIFEFVRNSLNASHRPPILLYGQRRMGKSSILKQLPRHLPADYVCVYYDLQGRAQFSLDEVLYGLARAIADALKIPRPAEENATGETFGAWFRDLDIEAGRLLLLFDEFDVIDQQFTGPEIAARRFIPYLAGLISANPQTGFILVVGRRTDELSEGFFSSLLKDAVQKRIGRLDRKDMDRLATDSFGPSAVSVETLDAIARLSAGHPFCVQVLCYAIWNRCRQHGLTAPITADDVEASFLPAIELGTLGLNWVYDGLEKPAHRLFLSALASLSGPKALEPVGYDAIERSLIAKRLGVDVQQLRMVPRDLQNWDIVEGPTAGFRFTVPMIGAWIQLNRPLEGLEQETRLINPRATRYFELALDSVQRSDWTEAIDNYQKALSANPVFVEAQEGLATALRARNLPEDLEAAIEAFERVIQLDPNSPRTSLLDALVAGIEASRADPVEAIVRFKRLQDLDTDGMFVERGKRLIEHMAQVRFGFGGSVYLREAITLWDAAGNGESASLARIKLVDVDRSSNIAMAVWVVSTLLFLITVYFAGKFGMFTPFLQLGLGVLAGLAISTGILADHEPEITFRRIGLAPLLLAVGYLAAFLLMHWRPSPLGGGVGAFFLAVILNMLLNPNVIPATPSELSAPKTAVATSLREAVANQFERWARRLKPASWPPKSME